MMEGHLEYRITKTDVHGMTSFLRSASPEGVRSLIPKI